MPPASVPLLFVLLQVQPASLFQFDRALLGAFVSPPHASVVLPFEYFLLFSWLPFQPIFFSLLQFVIVLLSIFTLLAAIAELLLLWQFWLLLLPFPRLLSEPSLQQLIELGVLLPAMPSAQALAAPAPQQLSKLTAKRPTARHIPSRPFPIQLANSSLLLRLLQASFGFLYPGAAGSLSSDFLRAVLQGRSTSL